MIIFHNGKIRYELSTESNVISHLQGRLSDDSLLCTLTYEGDVKNASQLPTDQLIPLGRVRACYEEGKPSFESI